MANDCPPSSLRFACPSAFARPKPGPPPSPSGNTVEPARYPSPTTGERAKRKFTERALPLMQRLKLPAHFLCHHGADHRLPIPGQVRRPAGQRHYQGIGNETDRRQQLPGAMFGGGLSRLPGHYFLPHPRGQPLLFRQKTTGLPFDGQPVRQGTRWRFPPGL